MCEFTEGTVTCLLGHLEGGERRQQVVNHAKSREEERTGQETETHANQGGMHRDICVGVVKDMVQNTLS